MTTHHIEEYEFKGPNVRYITDSKGEGHYCELDEDEGLENCVSEKDWAYDRGFGG